MPPRYTYWTILVGGAPTAFRAREREELVPTLVQLRRRHPDAEMKWFAQGKLWDSPEQARWAREHANRGRPRRPKGWRPGGTHEDPRARFKKPRGRRFLEEGSGEQQARPPRGRRPSRDRRRPR